MTDDQPRSILIVDDDPDALQQLSHFLTRRGYHVALANSGEAAIKAVADQAIDFVISDIRMPGIGLEEMLTGIRKLDVDMPIALMTGQPDAHTILDPRHLGVAAVMKKPVSLRDVDALLRRFTP